MNSWRLAWRNLSRNRARTLICGIALAVTTALLIILHGMTYGMEDLITKGAIDLGVGEAQVHAKTYALDQSIYETLPTADAILAAAKANGIDAAPRALAGGLLSKTEKSSGARIWGVDIPAERALGNLPHHLLKGSFLPDQNDNHIVLGSELARLLSANVGDKIALIVQATDASTSTELMTVAGIFESVGDIDTSVAMIDRRDFEKLFLMNGKVHEVALSSHFRLPPEKVAALIAPAAGPDADVKTWQALLPAVKDVVDVFRSAANLLTFIFLAAAGLSLLNTMLMATTERFREFGILKALGATPRRILADVAREAFCLGAISTFAGGAIGGVSSLLLGKYGVDLSKMGKLAIGGVGFDPIWRSHPSVDGLVTPIISMMIVTFIAALYPAWVASRLVPVKAMTHV